MYSSRNTTGALKESIDPIDSFDEILEARSVPEPAVASEIVIDTLPLIGNSITPILFSDANEQRKAVFSLKAKSGILARSSGLADSKSYAYLPALNSAAFIAAPRSASPRCLRNGLVRSMLGKFKTSFFFVCIFPSEAWSIHAGGN